MGRALPRREHRLTGEIQRTLMELLNCLDGFDSLGAVKMIMATNRPTSSTWRCCGRAVWIARWRSSPERAGPETS